MSALLLLGGAVLHAEAQQPAFSTPSAGMWTRLGHVDEVPALSGPASLVAVMGGDSMHPQILRRIALATPLGALLERIRGEYREMPGLKLTPAQAQRLWRISAERCAATLRRLVEERFLRATPDGSFMRNLS